jgi:DNA-directed RNA polymerase subunit RPC12/RpoP
MIFLPRLCQHCLAQTLEVIEINPDDSGEAKCTTCGHREFFRSAAAEKLINDRRKDVTPKVN